MYSSFNAGTQIPFLLTVWLCFLYFCFRHLLPISLWIFTPAYACSVLHAEEDQNSTQGFEGQKEAPIQVRSLPSASLQISLLACL
jgi:hypothetical protein